MMETTNLQAFVKIAETGSFSVAASQLYLTQPAISKRIKQLESQLDSKLLDRHGKQIQLTQTGHALLPRARQILQDIENTRQQISDIEGNPVGSFRMATSHHIGLHHLPPILRAFTALYPDVNLDLNFMDSEQACKLVESNELELAVVTLPFESSHKLKLTPIWNDQLIIICAADHPLVHINSPTLLDLVKYPAVLPSHGTFTREAIERALQGIREKLIINLETNYLETIKMMASVGLGWSILPQSMLDAGLYHLKIPAFQSSRKLGIVLNKNRSQSKAVTAMLELIKEVKD
ncbi:MAG: LysR family transcriptional regulator [Gammaproteobacteria bacterium]|jgi:DNA-binding transcriptional LysR family regulator|nr:LysR family transcriptional regulator [Gammaproteobacteria bacterium]